MIILRPYQEKAVTDLSAGFANYQRQVLQSDTGSGKTVMFCEIVRRAALKGTPTLIITHRTELLKQTFGALGKTGVPHQIISKDHKMISEQALVNVAMVETIKRRIAKGFKIDPKLIIIDEAHFRSFNTIIDMFPQARVIGATATPVGKHFYKYYQNIVTTIPIPDLIGQGYLAPCVAYQMQDDISDLEVRGDDYSEDSMFKHYDKPKLYAGVVEEYLKRTPGKKGICFNVNIEHAIKQNAAFNAAGIRSEVIHGNTPDADRVRILKAYSQGLFPVINNANILTTGFDDPSIEAVMINRSTMSLALWLQMCGRGSRMYPGKTHFIVMDFGMNHQKHGLWQEAREWKLEPPKKRKPKEQPAPVKSCPTCSAILPAVARKCQYCGHEFPIGQKELQQGVMVEVVPQTPPNLVGKKAKDLTIDELIELQKSKKWKATYVWRIVRSMGESSIKEYAGKMNYTSGWIYNQVKEIKNSAFRNYVLK